MAYTDWCEEAHDFCPGGPEQCLLSVNPLDPNVCFALGEDEDQEPPEIDPPGGPY